jgi:hypothetical protein
VCHHAASDRRGQELSRRLGGKPGRAGLHHMLARPPVGTDLSTEVRSRSRISHSRYAFRSLAGRYHGGRVDRDMTYQQAIARSYTDHETFKERPFLLDNVWDLQHLLDVLSERPDVDERRIGITGWVLTSSDVRSHTP